MGKDSIEMALLEALGAQGHFYESTGRKLIDELLKDLENFQTEPQARHVIGLMLQHQFYKLGR